MFLTRAATHRPVATLCMIAVLIIFGVISYWKLGMDVMPDIDVPYVTVTTVLPGADSGELEVNVARKIEDAVSGVDGLKHVNSTIMDDRVQTLLEFQLDTNLDTAALDVREKIDLIRNDLPPNTENPEIQKFNTNSKPVVTILVRGDLPLDQIYDYADDKLAEKFSIVPGVADVEVTGSEKMEFHITLNPEKLAGFGLTANDIAEKLRAANNRIPAGRLKDGKREVSVTFDSEIRDVEDAMLLEVGQKDGTRVYLRDLADIRMKAKESRSAAFLNGEPAISIKIIKKSEANSLKVVEGVRKAYNRVLTDGSLPGGIKLFWFTDDGEYVKENVNDTWFCVFFGMGITVLLLLLFLQDIRSTFVAAISMPVSILATFIVMRLFDYTLNSMTLLAIGISVGTLVTNSIVVLESIFKRVAKGDPPRLSAEKGTNDVVPPVFASAMTNVIVFVPIALMTSIAGRVFAPFAVTMTAATLASLALSFTLTPVLAERLGGLNRREKRRLFFFSAFADGFRKFYALLERFYLRGIEQVIRRPWRTVFYSVLLFILTVGFLVPKIGMTFFPQADRGEVSIRLEFPTYYNLNAAVKGAKELEQRIRLLKHVQRTATTVGKIQGTLGQASEGVHLAEILVKFNTKKERKESMDELRAMLRDVFRNDVGLLASVNIAPIVDGASRQLELEIAGSEFPVLEETARNIMNNIEAKGLATDLDSSIRAPRREIRIRPRRSILQDQGLSAENIGTMTRSNIEGLKVGTYKKDDRSFDIRVIMKEQPGVDQLSEYIFASKNGNPLQLENIASLENNAVPVQINRADKMRVAKIYANPAPGVSLSKLAQAVQTAAEKYLQPGCSVRFVGQVEKMKEASLDFATTLTLALILTYLMIAAVMESWRFPLIIMGTVPLAAIGMFLALYLTGLPLSMMGLLGAVMLIGIIVNNAILIMDGVATDRKNGATPADAVRNACRNKLRPIFMTSIAVMAGVLPMAFGSGLGSELRQAAGIGILGGLISSTVLSVYFIPALYLFFQKREENNS